MKIQEMLRNIKQIKIRIIRREHYKIFTFLVDSTVLKLLIKKWIKVND